MMTFEKEAARINMIKQQIRTWQVTDDNVLDLIAKIPRENFVPEAYRQLAFADMSIPLGHGQTMMSPMEEARVLQALQVKKTDKILVVGTAGGYITALLAKLGKHVYSVDSVEELTVAAEKKLATVKITNVTLETGDASQGWDEHSPYQVIVVTGSLPYLPTELRANLAKGGRLFAVLGESPVMEAVMLTRAGKEQWCTEKLFETKRPRLANVVEPDQFEF